MPNRHSVPQPHRRIVAMTAVVSFTVAATIGAFTMKSLPPGAKRPDLVRIVRLKLSAADLASAEAWTEDWRRDHGADAIFLDARAWLARGAWMLGETERALAFAREVHGAIPEATEELLIPLGAAYEVEGRILAEREGAAAGVAYFQRALEASDDVAFRSRMWKNINRLALVGRPAPELVADDRVGEGTPSLASLRGRPVLLFLWAHSCGDCSASAPTLARLRERYGPRGLAMIAPTRYYGGGRSGKPAGPAEEKAEVARVLAEKYPGLSGAPVPIDTATMVRYGASATPTFVLIDADGIVRLYEPTRLTFEALAAEVEKLLKTPS